ncbi:4-hydroxy-tetrahydrodipicolinate reductase [Helicobacter kayseriensis]|uniref:4-hydroxy-tetrahydrodipicolinate reductase n=1 Tax=Helicobacter kayseriensis TaxID=2905877 RepID=UPI001E5B48B9|nr:4-hydroxy-tetrahydrodipicolinate reductase [Helicobacter kayseriensis]MCE3048382.1 4-hydroxy-tetrahydrodipicolinate reductase [Helicobacter kayseriensis]
MLEVGLVGYGGKMGGLICDLIAQSGDLKLTSVYDHKNQRNLQSRQEDIYFSNDWGEFLKHSQAVIDFSTPQATFSLLEACLEIPRPLVIGTTGLSEETHQLMRKVSQSVPVVYATNTSQGINLLNQFAFLASKILEDCDIEIVEMHHRSKKDAPSGTAMTLAEYCANARGLELEEVRVSGRDGNIGKRDKQEIGVMSLRGGDIVGRHTVGFYCDGEYLELTHTATNRKTFALGALRAVRWVMVQKNGIFSMKEVLGQ